MNPKETTEYIKLRGAAIAFLEAEKAYKEALLWEEGIRSKRTRLDAARSVLWDVINDKEIKP